VLARHTDVFRPNGYLSDDAAGQVRHVDAVIVAGEGEDEAWTQGSMCLDEGRVGEERAPRPAGGAEAA
jgi:hypothetical protein